VSKPERSKFSSWIIRYRGQSFVLSEREFGRHAKTYRASMSSPFRRESSFGRSRFLKESAGAGGGYERNPGRDAVMINIPVAKSHSATGVSMGLKD